MYAYVFEGRRYDLGDKLGFLQATVDAALKKPELRDEFLKYLNQVCEKENSERQLFKWLRRIKSYIRWYLF